MTELEYFDLINRKCNCVLELVYEAEATTDVNRARILYGKAAQVTDNIISALRDRIYPYDKPLPLIKKAGLAA